MPRPLIGTRPLTPTERSARRRYAAAERMATLETALRIIAGQEQCIDNLMSNVDVARAALKLTQEKKP